MNTYYDNDKKVDIVTYKIYDSYKDALCLTHAELGAAKAITHCASSGNLDETIVRPPQGTMDIDIDNCQLEKISVIKKRPHKTRKGYWDITIGFTFKYLLSFFDINGCTICTVWASSAFVKKMTLYGGKDSSTWLFADICDTLMPSHPILRVQAKWDVHDAKIHHGPIDDCIDEVHVTIGLYTIVNLMRPTVLKITENHFCATKECEVAPDYCTEFALQPF